MIDLTDDEIIERLYEATGLALGSETTSHMIAAIRAMIAEAAPQWNYSWANVPRNHATDILWVTPSGLDVFKAAWKFSEEDGYAWRDPDDSELISKEDGLCWMLMPDLPQPPKGKV